MTTVATDCPPPSSVVEYVEGTQKPGERLEFEEHMDGCQACLELVATLASLSVDPTTTGQDLRGLSAGLGILRRGENVGRYLVLEVLGAGGMGVIYSAYDPELDRRVALKLLHARERAADGHPTADSRDDAARLTREARAMARLSHRNVIAVYDVGTFEGHVYITMECIEGVTLRTWCQSAKRPWREVVDVFCRAGRGLAAAHAAGLVHHDFKPSNVMVSEGRVVVLDFGLAREHHNTPPQSGRGTHERAPFTDVDTTSTGVVIGTPAYMSPEQRVGRRADARSDQYSFCLALTEALLGVPARGSATVDNTIPAPIRTTLRRGLSEDPGARFPAMDRLLDRLERAISRRRRRRIGLALSGVAVAATAGIIGAYTNFNRPAAPAAPQPCEALERQLDGVWDGRIRQAIGQNLGAPERPAPVVRQLDSYAESWVRHSRDACLATRVHGEQTERQLELRTTCLNRQLRNLRALTGQLAGGSRKVGEFAATAVAALEPLDRCTDLEALEQRAAGRPPAGDDAATLDELAELQALRDTGQYTAASLRSGPLVERVQAQNNPSLLAEALLLHGDVLVRTDRGEEAGEVLLKALWAAEDGGHDRARAMAWLDLLYLHGYQQANVAQGERLAQHAQAVLTRIGGDTTLEARRLSVLGLMYNDASQLDTALTHQREAVALLRRAQGLQRPRLAHALHGLANTQKDLGNDDAAEQSYREALAIGVEVHGARHPDVGKTQMGLGNVLRQLGRRDEALEMYKAGLETLRVVHGERSRDVAIARYNLATIYSDRGAYKLALHEHEAVAEVFAELLPEGHPHRITVANAIGREQHLLGDLDAAEATLRGVVASLEKKLAEGTQAVAPIALGSALNFLGQVLIARPEGLREALQVYVRAEAIYRDRLGPEHPMIVAVMLNRGDALRQAGKRGEAQKVLEQAIALGERTDSPYTAEAMTSLGALHREQGELGQAVTALRRGLSLAAKTEIEPIKLALLRFELARCLWPESSARGEARELASQALAGIDASTFAANYETVSSWLDAHPAEE